MENKNKFYFGRIMGELLRIEKRIDPKMVNHWDDVIFGLLHGIEPVIDEFFPEDNEPYRQIITKEDYSTFCDIMNECRRMGDDFRGYYDVEDKYSFERGKACIILDYFRLAGLYPDIVEKINSEHSPVEVRYGHIDKEKDV